ncbi:PAS domain-containing protein [uncultured Abyssibacter sp.]|uniref:PAS domain-containing protein n=1 Tax=uncultured Abyssibacter sp. TaxID=2320202 RepID=UPI0032B2EA0C
MRLNDSPILPALAALVLAVAGVILFREYAGQAPPPLVTEALVILAILLVALTFQAYRQTREDGDLSDRASWAFTWHDDTLQLTPRLSSEIGLGSTSWTDTALYARLAPNDQSAVRRAVKQHLEHGTAFALPLSIHRSNGDRLGMWMQAEAVDRTTASEATITGILRPLTDDEAVLAKALERVSLAVSGGRDGLWDWDIESGETWFSPRFLALLGYPEDDGFPSNFPGIQDRLHPAEAQEVLARMGALPREETGFDIEFRLRTRSGEYRWFRSRGEALRGADGRAYRMTGSIQDIHDRRDAIARASSINDEARGLAHLMDILEFAPDIAFWSWDIATGFFWNSDKFSRVLGIDDVHQRISTRETFCGFLHKDDRSRVYRAMETAIEDVAPFRQSFRVVLPSGDTRSIEMWGAALSDRDSLVRAQTQVFGGAIWSRETAEHTARYRDRLEAAVAKAPIPCVVLDAERHVVLINAAASNVYGLDTTGFPLVGRSMHRVIETEPLADYAAACEDLLTGREETVILDVIRTSAGRRQSLQLRLEALRSEDFGVDGIAEFVSRQGEGDITA